MFITHLQKLQTEYAGCSLVYEVPMNTPFALNPPTLFCEYEECFQPVGCFPYTTRDGKIFCSPECFYLAEEDADAANAHLEKAVG